MLSVPTLAQILTVVVVALFGTAALVTALALLTGTGRRPAARRGETSGPAPVRGLGVPAQRAGEHVMIKYCRPA